jgi:predicted TIM-barrel fold metal-dependent hydrolase
MHDSKMSTESTTQRVPVIDAQVHAYERDRPERPWVGWLHGPAEVTGDDLVEAMDAVAVDGALLISPFAMYGYDPGYVLEVYARYPGRFGLIRPFDPRADGVADEFARWAATPGVVGARIMLAGEAPPAADDPGVNRILAAGAKHGLPVNLHCWGHIPLLRALARRHPDTQIVVDHLGLQQPFEPPVPAEPFADLEAVLALAEHENVAIKITGACTLSRQSFPYPDLWDPLGRIFDAFGIDRCMWGTDWTRAVELLTYEQGVEAFRVTDRLSDSERSALMGGSLARIYDWSPDVE